jgi:hypothetical protein
LKPQAKLSTSPFFADFVQKPRDSFLLREAGAIEVFANGERKLILAHAVLPDNVVQGILSVDCTGVFGIVSWGTFAGDCAIGVWVGSFLCIAVGTIRVLALTEEMGSLRSYGGWRSEADSSGEKELGVFVGKSAGRG